MYHSGDLAIGFSYILGKNSESVKAEVIGTTENSYNAFLDKGLMYGAYEAWDGSGIHLSESGINGFPIKECRTGEPCNFNGKDFTEMQNTHILQVLPVKEMLSGSNFHTHRITSHLSYHFKQGKKEHFLRLNLQWSHLVNNENVINKETVNGITTTYINGSNRIFERMLSRSIPNMNL